MVLRSPVEAIVIKIDPREIFRFNFCLLSPHNEYKPVYCGTKFFDFLLTSPKLIIIWDSGLFVAKPFSESMLASCRLNSRDDIFVQFEIWYNHISLKKVHGKISSKISAILVRPQHVNSTDFRTWLHVRHLICGESIHFLLRKSIIVCINVRWFLCSIIILSYFSFTLFSHIYRHSLDFARPIKKLSIYSIYT